MSLHLYAVERYTNRSSLGKTERHETVSSLLNITDCYFYSWGILDVLYGLFEHIEDVKRSKEIILFEGCKSVLLAETWNIHNTAAILTSHLNPRQMKILASLGCRVVFALDSDVDVTKDHNIAKLSHYVNVEYIRDTAGLLDAKDAPVDKGEEVFRKLYADHRIKIRS